MEGTEDRISELEDRTMEITQSEQHIENRLIKNFLKRSRASGTCGVIIKDLTFQLEESQK